MQRAIIMASMADWSGKRWSMSRQNGWRAPEFQGAAPRRGKHRGTGRGFVHFPLMSRSLAKIGRIGAVAAVLLSVAPGVAAAQNAPGATAPPGPVGEWLVAKRIARIRIVDCDGRLWGVVTWEAQPGIDRKNPNPALRSRPTLGMPVLLGMTRTKPYQWDGQIYNAQDGHTYSASISLLGPNTLRVKGCFLSVLCGGENWTRVESPPPEGQKNADKVPMPPQRPKKPSGQRTPAAQQPAQPTPIAAQTDEEICLGLFGPARLPHERRLK
jgi:uncharacterized protein (DUF2147 family)